MQTRILTCVRLLFLEKSTYRHIYKRNITDQVVRISERDNSLLLVFIVKTEESKSNTYVIERSYYFKKVIYRCNQALALDFLQVTLTDAPINARSGGNMTVILVDFASMYDDAAEHPAP